VPAFGTKAATEQMLKLVKAAENFMVEMLLRYE
jgi:hypothetical protein